jgi:peroxiredoxin
MKRLLTIILIICAAAGCIKEQTAGSDIRIGDPLPVFEVMMNDGSSISDVSLKGDVSIVMFFHTSCPDCQQVLPVMQRIYDEYTREGIKTALISREENSDDISAYWSENNFNMPYSAQKDRNIYELFATSRIPRIYISDENGTVRYIFTDDPVPSYDDLKSALESLIR